MDRVSVVSLMNRAYRKGVRRGLGMRKRDSVVDRLGEMVCGSVRKSEGIAVVSPFCEWCSKLLAYRNRAN